ncbi:MAG TPA: hypothetical protein VFQ72_03545, partial [Candidatus Paceibacterota bacterium]|nr:hypothetical protein [Candidatus Paceibacterota bacterium]
DMVRKMSAANYAPGTLGAGLAYAAKDTKDQWDDKNIVMLGSRVEIDGTVVVPSMQYISWWFCGYGRYMNLHPFDWKGWDRKTQSLGVRFK